MAAQSQNDTKALWAVISVLAFLFIVFLVFALALYSTVSSESSLGEKIGVVEISDTIVKSDTVVKNLRKFDEDSSVKGIIIRIDSPGGSVAASQEILEAIRGVNKKSVISMGNMAASGGYYVACSGPKIYANPGTLTGSIGVISQVVQANEVLDFLKLKVHTIKTGTYKDSGSPYREFTEADRKLFTDLGNDIYQQFVDAIVEARKIPKEEVLKFADGRVLTGKQAKELGLVDELGGFNAAIDDLKKQLNIKGNVQLVYPSQNANAIVDMLLQEGASTLRQELKNAANPTESFQYLYVQ